MTGPEVRRVAGITAVAAMVVSLLVGVVAGPSASAAPSGTITTLVDDAPAYPFAVTRSGTVFYVSTGGQVVRRTPDGVRTVLAGAGTVGSYTVKSTPKPAASIQFASLRGVFLDPSERNLYVIDYGWTAVLRIDLATGTIVRVAGNPYDTNLPSPDGGQAVDTVLALPISVAVAANGDVYIGQAFSGQSIRKVDAATGVISCWAECINPPNRPGDDGPATTAYIRPDDLVLDGNRMLVAQNASYFYTARSIDMGTRVITRFAGRYTNIPGARPYPCGVLGDGGPAVDACLNGPHGVAVAPNGDRLIAASGLRVVSPSGVIDTVACGQTGPVENLPPVGQTADTSTATDCSVYKVRVDAAGRYYIGTSGNKIAVIDPKAPSTTTTTSSTSTSSSTSSTSTSTSTSSTSTTTTSTTTPGGGGSKVTFQPVSPVRVLDSRPGTRVGAYSTPWTSGETRTVQITGNGGVPTNATAVVFNLTATSPTDATHITVWPAGQPQPTASNLNLPSGATDAALVTVPVGTGGKVSMFNNSGNVDLIADIAGYYAADDTGTLFTGLTPRRGFDSRTGRGTNAAPFAAGETRVFDLAGDPDIPADATAVVFNLTGTNATAGTDLRVWPAGQPKPTVSNLNLTPGRTDANLVVVPFRAGTRQVSIANQAGTVDVIADVAGYYRPGTGNQFTPVSPTRALDSRPVSQIGDYSTPWTTFTSRAVKVTGIAGVPADATAVVVNVTGTNVAAATHLSVYPTGQPPLMNVSNLNLSAGRTEANMAVVPVGIDGQITVFNNSGSVDVVMDIAGWYAP